MGERTGGKASPAAPEPAAPPIQPPPDLEPLLAFLPIVADPAFPHGEWRGGETRNGVTQMPFFAYAAEADALVQAAYRANWVRPEIHWSKWAAGSRYKQLRTDPGALGTASTGELAHLLTTLIRGDRFNEGLLAGAFADGTVRRILERAARLAQGGGETPGGSGRASM